LAHRTPPARLRLRVVQLLAEERHQAALAGHVLLELLLLPPTDLSQVADALYVWGERVRRGDPASVLAGHRRAVENVEQLEHFADLAPAEVEPRLELRRLQPALGGTELAQHGFNVLRGREGRANEVVRDLVVLRPEIGRASCRERVKAPAVGLRLADAR